MPKVIIIVLAALAVALLGAAEALAPPQAEAAQIASAVPTQVTEGASLPQAQSAPTVSRISFGASPRSGDTYRSGEAIRVTVNFSRAVTVAGTPQLELTIGQTRRQANYFYGSGSRNLKFSYTVQAADRDTNGVSIAANALSLNSGTIRAGTQGATLTHTGVADDATRKVNGGGSVPLKPSFGSATVAAQSYVQHVAITPLTLPQATGGNGAVSYALTPALPTGLVYNPPAAGVANAGTITGTPRLPNLATTYTLTAHDADTDRTPDDAATLAFTITITVAFDYDRDDDGLIDVYDLTQLNAVRWDLNGDGAVDTGTSVADAARYIFAFVNASTGMGCLRDHDDNTETAKVAGCIGYELTRDLDFDQNADGQITSADVTYWNNGAVWQPIQSGTSVSATGFAGIFDGNHKTISNLYMASRAAYVGLFGQVASGGTIRNVRLAAVNIDRTGNSYSVGGLAGENAGTITASYVTGRVSSTGNTSQVGGLVGKNTGTIAASYSTAAVSGGDTLRAGGLAGWNDGKIIASYAMGPTSSTRTLTDPLVGSLVGHNTGAITASYATGAPSGQGSRVGGLVGSNNRGTVVSSYYDTETTGRSSSTGGVGQTTGRLQTPTAYGSGDSIYAGWNVDVDNADNDNNLATQPDNPWNFGTAGQYPTLRYFAAGSVPPKPSFGSATVAAQSYVQNVAITALTLPQATGGNGAVSYALTPALPDGLVYNPPAAGVANAGTVTGTPRVPASVATTYILTAHDADTDRTPDDAATLAFTITITVVDYDLDNDGLIDVSSLTQLNAVRWDLNGDGAVDTGTSVADAARYLLAFVNASTGMGCLRDHDDNTETAKVAGCIGYELTRDLDFDTDGDGATYTTSSTGVVTGDAGDAYYNGGKGWKPIGNSSTSSFTATFYGSGKTIANLFIKDTAADVVGLFGVVGTGGRVERLAVRDVNVTGSVWSTEYVSSLVGWNSGTISASHATGSVTVANAPRQKPPWPSCLVGGLVGWNSGTISTSYANSSVGPVPSSATVGGLAGWNSGAISASYATGSVAGYSTVGGLVGMNYGGAISASYATGSVTGNYSVGGLVGTNSGAISASYAAGSVTGDTNTNSGVGGLVGSDTFFRVGTATHSYWDTGTTGQSTSAGGIGKTTRDLQSPTGYTGIYANWNTNLDGVAGNDDPWDFRANRQYPTLKYGGLDPAKQRQTSIRSDNWNNPVVGEPVVASLNVTGATGIAWQWQGSINGSTWTNISNATGATYVPVTADVGKQLRAKVSFTASGNAQTLTTINTAKVVATTPATTVTGAVAFVPDVTVGAKLEYAVSGTGTTDHSWRWQRCTNKEMTSGCAYIGDGAAAYRIAAADVGKYLRAYVYYADGSAWKRTTTPVLGPVVAAPAASP